MSRLTEKLAAAAAVAPRQHAKIEARADRVIEREGEIESQADQAFLPHERMLDEAENGLSALEKELAVLTNHPPLERFTPLPNAPRVLPDVPAATGDRNEPKAAPAPIVGQIAMPETTEGAIWLKSPRTMEVGKELSTTFPDEHHDDL